MSDDPYVYPGTAILRNRLDIRDGVELDRMERELAGQRMAEGVPLGDFDMLHLRAIHRHLFQDVYDWAGEIRTVEISKGTSNFQPRPYIEVGMGDVHRRILAAGYLRDLVPAAFAAQAAVIIGDVNYVHPFREGNGRTQALYLVQLAMQAGHVLDLRRLPQPGWIEASIAAHEGEYAEMQAAIERALSGGR